MSPAVGSFTRQGVEVYYVLPRLALTRHEIAASLGVSTSFFDRHIRDELMVVYRGSTRLYPVTEVGRWLTRNAAVRPVVRSGTN